MKHVGIIYWSGTGNTEAMAELIALGVGRAGGFASIVATSELKAGHLKRFDAIAFGCPATGDEELEPHEFLPVYEEAKLRMPGIPMVLFGSFKWGRGEWMNAWRTRATADGVCVVGTAIARGYPRQADEERFIELGRRLVSEI